MDKYKRVSETRISLCLELVFEGEKSRIIYKRKCMENNSFIGNHYVIKLKLKKTWKLCGSLELEHAEKGF